MPYQPAAAERHLNSEQCDRMLKQRRWSAIHRHACLTGSSSISFLLISPLLPAIDAMRGLLQRAHSTRRSFGANASTSRSTQQASQAGKLQSKWYNARNAAVATAGAGTVAYSLLGFKLDSLKPESHAGKPSSYPTIPTPPPSSVQSSIPPLTVEEATARLRQGEGSLPFDAGDGKKGRFDYCRYACNSPVEDDYSFGSAEGAGTGGRPDWRYWGIYDGHAWVHVPYLLQEYHADILYDAADGLLRLSCAST